MTLLTMSRENFQKYGLIAALIVAGITLPTSIVSFMREPTIVNNYEQNYNAYYNQTYNYNQTYYGDDDTNYTKLLETVEYYNLDQFDYFVRNFTLSTNYVYWCHWNASTQIGLQYYILRGIYLERVLELNGTSLVQFLDKVRSYQSSDNKDESSFYYVPPFTSEWLFIFVQGDAFFVNITLTDEILKI
jgi:hypothetical protein